MSYSKRYMSDAERLRLWNALSNPKFRLVCKMMFFMGLRISETLRIRLQDINLKEKTLTVPTQKNKAIINELCMIPNPVFESLKAYLETFDKEIEQSKGWIFFSKRREYRPITLNSWESIMRTARIKAGLQEGTSVLTSINGKEYHRICSHVHKNESIRFIYNQTGDLRKAQTQGHHTNLNSTVRYIGNPLFDLATKNKILDIWNTQG